MLNGSLFALILYDVAEAIDLTVLAGILQLQTLEQSFKHTTPAYLGLDIPPVEQRLPPMQIEGGASAQVQMKYYEYGVVSILFELPFNGSWDSLIVLSAAWMAGGEFESKALALARSMLAQAAPALTKPHKSWLTEDYVISHMTEISGCTSAAALVTQHGANIARLIRGETAQLSAGEQSEVLQSSISYYANDLAVIGWNAAFIFDTKSGAATAMQLLEYANLQLLEFRYYDELLTGELKSVYRALDRGTGILDRWRLAGEASKLQTVLLDVTELTERLDHALKFLSDMFSARLYRLAANKVGVQDYKDQVNQKLRTAEELYRFLMDQFHQNRAFILELTVVVILVIELVHIFVGKR